MVTVGLEVPHAHVHLIPINTAEDINFANPKLQLTTEEFQQIQELIVSKLAN
jgi:histidine triad (HIT) family protein